MHAMQPRQVSKWLTHCGFIVGLAVSRQFHEIDAPARRIHFFVPENVGRADRQAEAAVHALVDDFSRGRMMRVEGAWRQAAKLVLGSGHQMPPTKRPGFSVAFGSNCCFTARMSGSASPGSPQASSAGMADGR